MCAVVHRGIVLSWQQVLVHCGQTLAVWVFLVDPKETWEESAENWKQTKK